MREYGKVAPTFWTGDTGRRLRKMGPRVQLVALYLITGPHANMIGLYYLPLPTLCHETGLPLEGALKALASLSEGGFAKYDRDSEVVWIPEMARFQLGDEIQPKDNRQKGVLREAEKYRKSPFFTEFYGRYRVAFCLPEPSPLEAPPKPLGSQEQEQEQEKEKEGEQEKEKEKDRGRDRPPSLQEVTDHCRQRNSRIDPEAFHAHYSANGWKQSNGRPIVDWRQAVITWEKNQARFGDRRTGATGTTNGKRPIAGEFDPSRHRAPEVPDAGAGGAGLAG